MIILFIYLYIFLLSYSPNFLHSFLELPTDRFVNSFTAFGFQFYFILFVGYFIIITIIIISIIIIIIIIVIIIILAYYKCIDLFVTDSSSGLRV